MGSASAADVAALQDDVADIDGNLSVATSVQVVESADASGRGITLAVRQDGAAADLTGATVNFVWEHRLPANARG